MGAPEHELRIVGVESTELFVGSPSAPDQVVRVVLDGAPGPVSVEVSGAAVGSPTPARAVLAGGRPTTVEVPVRFVIGTQPGGALPATVLATRLHDASGAGTQGGRPTAPAAPDQARAEVMLSVAEPGWTMYLVSHFHYDPVWWNTQASYTASWDAREWTGNPRAEFEHNGFELVRAYLELARHDPDYRFVLAETDYLKPYWDVHPEDRDYLRRLLAEGRCELLGGTYNEPNTNLTGPETTIRNLVLGIGFQRSVLGGDPQTAWQLDVFGHDPQFPGWAAAAGLTASAWARGPFHQWGPLQTTPAQPFRDARVMQFPSEFEWVAPSGHGLLTSYMPAHYSAGWWMDSAPTLADAEEAVYRIFRALKVVAATRNVLLPVGTDYSPPNKWVTQIHRDWAARYVWPRFVCAVPRDFFAAVRAELAAGRPLTPQTRDMNPIYTGKDVSYIDTKLAQRQAETALADAERFATFAALDGARYPQAALDKAWRQLAYGAHHDAITGSESDQVYLDLLTGWREAWQLGRDVRDAAQRHLAASISAPADPAAANLVVFNGLSWPRTDVVRVQVEPPFVTAGLSVVDDAGAEVPFLAEGALLRRGGGLAHVTLTFLARDVPATGYRTYRLRAASTPVAGLGWRPTAPTVARISNERYEVDVDPRRGGCVSRLVDRDTGRELLRAGQVGNELLVYDEYPQHPQHGEGPWHLLPKGPPKAATGDRPAAEVRVAQCPIGARAVIHGSLATVRYTQEITLWHGVSRVDCVTYLDELQGADQLFRLRWPADVSGGLPVSEVGNAVVGRGFGIIDVDTAEAPWTLDNPAHTWFGLGSTARVVLSGSTRDPGEPGGPDGPVGSVGSVARAIGVAEVVAPVELVGSGPVRDLLVALVRAGVTATTSADLGGRYGYLDVDSNLPDVRLAVGGPERNAFTEQVLTAADPAFRAELHRQLAQCGQARVWVPAARPLAEVWVPNADLRAPRSLPVLVVAGRAESALHAALGEVAADLADAAIEVAQPAALHVAEPGLDDRSVAVFNRGLPGFAVDPSGALHLSLLRSCTGWPSGTWIDPPRRSTPDGSGFQLQHWTHRFEYALAAGPGDWRSAGFVPAGQGFSAPLTAVLGHHPAGHADRPDRDADQPAGPGRSGRPSTASLVSVEPAGSALVTAVKPAGNPLAHCSAAEVAATDAITVRLYEPHGRPVQARVRLAVPVSAAHAADLLERPGAALAVEPDGGFVVPIDGAGMASAVVVPVPPAAGWPAAEASLAADIEPVQPVYARYWLHNAGPAPTGNLPVSVHARPSTVLADGPVRVTVTAVSDLTDDAWSGLVRVSVPDGWQAVPEVWPVALPPGGHAELPVTVTPARHAVSGDHLVGLCIEDAGQLVEDVLTVRVPAVATGLGATGGLSVRLDPPALAVRPGQREVLRARLANQFRSPVHGLAQLVGPVETWPLTPHWVQPVRLAGDDFASVDFPIVVPPDTRPGSWWLLVKLMYAGRVGYTDSIRLTVDPPGR